jgi:uncharacterized protein YggE
MNFESMNSFVSGGLKKVTTFAIGALAVFLIVETISGLANIGQGEREYPAQNIISVSGKGEVVAIPDTATFSFAVTEEASTVALAQKAATTKINATIAAFKEKGIADKDIKTTYYSINPRYEYQRGAPTYYPPVGERQLVGYEVSQGIEVKVRNIEKAGEMLSLAGAQGVQNVSGLSFTVDKEEDLKREARDKAIVEAKSEAKKLAKSLGVRITNLVSFSESGPYPIYAKYGFDVSATRGGFESSPAPEVPVGENKIVSNVTITYEIR